MRRSVILVIRPDDSFSRQLRESGFDVLNLALIATEPLEDTAKLVESIKRIGQFDGVFITSPIAAEIFVKQLDDKATKYSGKIYVLGERSRDVLADSDLDLAYCETANTAADLIASFGEAEFAGKHLLFVRGDRTVGTIQQALKGKARVNELIVYRTIENKPDKDMVKEIKARFEKNEIERVCFFSPSAVRSFVEIFGEVDLTYLKCAAIGETTARSARESGLNIDFVPQRSTAEDFAAGLAAYINGIE